MAFLETLLLFVFWASLAVLAYTYVGYPVLLKILTLLRPRPVGIKPHRPTVSLIIAAYNEEKVIRDKLRNTLALTYPKDRLQVIVAADGSDDATVSIASEYADRGVTVLHHPARRGKSAAISRAVESATGEIILFADANTVYHPDLVQNITRNFADETVGAVSGRKILIEDDTRDASRGETAYWGYEASLKVWESLLGSIVTADGEVFAIRKGLFEAIPKDVVHDDMYLTLRMVSRGFRVVYDEDATSAERASKNVWDEFHLKVRYASAGFQIVARFRQMLLPPRTLFAFQFFSHKILRWTAPFFLLACLVANAGIVSPFYRGMLLAQGGFYLAALLGGLLHRHLKVPLIYFPFYFCMGNAAAFYGGIRFLKGGQTPLWRKAER